MNTQILIYLLVIFTVIGYFISQRQAQAFKNNRIEKDKKLNSLPRYYGYYTALWTAVPAFILLVLWMSFEGSIIDAALFQQVPLEMQSDNASLILNDIKLAAIESKNSIPLSDEMKPLVEHYRSAVSHSKTLKTVLVLAVAMAGGIFGFSRFSAVFRARSRVEKWIKSILLICSLIAIITTIGIVASVLFESLIFFQSVSPIEFLFGTHWSPTAAEPGFGAVPLFLGTLMISLIALIISVPIGLMAAIYLSEYANYRVRSIAKPALELLAGIPTVVYGFFAVLTIAPAFRGAGERLGLNVASESALAAGVVMGVMIIPFVSSLSDDAITSVPQYLRDGSLGLGATKSETIKQVVLPAALPGIVGGVLLAASRAIGETMIVVMAAGMAANMTVNPLQAVTTVTVQIVTLLTGDQEFDSPKTLAAFALALLLFCVTLVLNLAAQHVVKKYREQYD